MTQEGAGAAAEAAGHGGAFDPGAAIFHHISDGQMLEVPVVGEVRLPTLHLGPYDVSITKHVVMMGVSAAIVLALAWMAARRRRLVPGRVQSLVEILVVFVRDEIARKSIGPGGDRYVSYLLSTFFFILTCNLLGLVPYGSTATGNIGVTAGLAGIAFLMTQFAGIREHGFVHHFRNLVPPGLPLWLMPIIIPVEILGMFAKPFALCVRLFANMTAGHVAILSLISLIFILKSVLVGVFMSVPFALFIDAIEILVAFLQAYIFTMLTSLFIGMSVHPAH